MNALVDSSNHRPHPKPQFLPNNVCCLKVRGTLGISGKTVPFPKHTHPPEGLHRYGKTIRSVPGGNLYFPPSQSRLKQTAGLRSSLVRVQIPGLPFYSQLRSCLQPLLAYPWPLMHHFRTRTNLNIYSFPLYSWENRSRNRQPPNTGKQALNHYPCF